MNFIISEKNSEYIAHIENGHKLNNPAIFSGSGKSAEEAIGKCIISNREALNITFEIHKQKEILYSTVFGKARRKT